jgi:quercetin 2,3-dioxygenase
MLSGYFKHKDSEGNTGKLGPSDVQWMTSGRGIKHSEMPEKGFALKVGKFIVSSSALTCRNLIR